MASGYVWQTNRRFTMKSLKSFGMGKSTMHSIIAREVDDIIAYFEKRLDKPTSITTAIYVAVVNGLFMIISGAK